MGETIVVAGPAQVGKTRVCRRLSAESGAWRLNLDPARQDPSPNGCVSLFEPGEKPHGIRFIGALSLADDPVAALEAVSWAMRAAGRDLVCELPLDRPTPVMMHLLRAVVTLLRPERMICIGADADTLQPLDSARIERLEPETGGPRPQSAVIAWRKAAWRGLFFGREAVSIQLGSLRIVGARLGSGQAVDLEAVAELEAAHAERVRNTLYVVTAAQPEAAAIHRACDAVGCETAHIVDRRSFRGLLAGIENKLGEHFAVARITDIDFRERAVRVATPAEPPFPAWRLRLGRLILDEDGNELGHLKPWQV